MIRGILFRSLMLLILASTFLSCSRERIDRNKIEEYLEENGLVAESTADGIYYIIEREGTGERPNILNTVTVHYRGYFLDGEEFDSSYARNEVSTFPLSGVIVGWQLGIPLFREGGKGTLFIPSELAYGRNGRGSIPGNTVLAFDIELFDVD